MTDDPDNVVPLKRKRPPGPGRGNRIKQGNGASAYSSAGPGWGGPKRGDDAIKGPESLIPGQPEAKRALSAANAEKSEELNRRMRAVIVGIADDEAQPANVRVAAAVAMLNRDEGMPTQTQKVEHSGHLDTSPEDAEDRIAEIMARAAQRAAINGSLQ